MAASRGGACRVAGGARRVVLTLTLAVAAATLLTSCSSGCRGLFEDDLHSTETAYAHVFVGTVVDATWTASQVEVEEVWSGPDLAPRVWLQSSLLPDAPLGVGERLVIAVWEGRRGRLRTGPCSVEAPGSRVMEELRPADVRAPVDGAVAGLAPISTHIPATRPYALAMLAVFVGIAVAIVRRARVQDVPGGDPTS